jgi:MYXO-CTERM domain-containing protein
MGKLDVSPHTPTVGGTVTIGGTGFGARVPVRVTTKSGLLADTESDASGSIALLVRLPTGMTGPQDVTASGRSKDNSTARLSGRFVVKATALPGTADHSLPIVAGGLALLVVVVLFLVRRRQRANARRR